MRTFRHRFFSLVAGMAIAPAAFAIIGGGDVRPLPGGGTPYPFMVSLQDATDLQAQDFAGPGGAQTCGGTLVGANLVLTASHCVYLFEKLTPPSHLWFNGLDRRQAGETGTVKGVVYFQPRPDLPFGDGLALVVLDRPVSPGKLIRVAGAGSVHAGQHATILGWGMAKKWTGQGPMLSPVLKQLDVSLLSYVQALSAPGVSAEDLHLYGPKASGALGDDLYLSAGAASGEGVCAADSGGPLLISSADGQPRVAGAVYGIYSPPCGSSPSLINNATGAVFSSLMRVAGASPLLPFKEYASSPSQQAVAVTLERIRANASAGMQEALGKLLLDDSADIAASLDSLHPADLSRQVRLADAVGDSISAQSSLRLAQWRAGVAAGLHVSAAGSTPAPLSARDQARLEAVNARWKELLGANSAAYLETGWLRPSDNAMVRQYTLGVEHRFNREGADNTGSTGSTVAGFALNRLDGSLSGWHAGFMGSYHLPFGWYVAANLGSGHFRLNQARTIRLGNGEQGVARSATRSHLAQLGLEVGRELRDVIAAARLAPYSRLDWQRYAVQDYREDSGTPFGLAVAPAAVTALSASVGMRASWTVDTQSDWRVVPDLNLALRQSLYRSRAGYTATFTDAACGKNDCRFSGFSEISSGSVADNFTLDAGVNLINAKRGQLRASYRTQPFGGGQRLQETRLNMALRW